MRSFRENLRHLRILIGSERRWRWPLLFVLALVVTLFEAVGALLIFVLLGLVAEPGAAVTLPLLGDIRGWLPGGLNETDIRLLVAGVVAGFFLLRFFVLAGRAYVQNRIVNNTGAQIAGRLLRGYLRLPYLFHTKRSSAELVRNTFDSTQRMVVQALKPMVEVAAESILVIGLTAILLATSPMATVLAVAVLGPTVLLLQRSVQPRLRDFGRQAQDASTVSIGAVQQALGGVRDIKLLGREAEFASRHEKQRAKLSRAQHLAQTLKELPRALIETSLVLVIVGVFMAAILTGTAVEEVLSTLGLFAYAGLRIQPSLQKVVAGLNQLRFSTAILQDLSTDQELITTWTRQLDDVADGPEPSSTGVEAPSRDASFAESIEAHAASFAYDDGNAPVLRDVALTIRKGEFVGICGPTGGGKSTFVDLLVGLLEPTSGSVRVDGRPLGPEPRWWWAQLGVVSQQVFLSDDTLRANIAFGETDAQVDDDRLASCIRRAQLDEVVGSLPEGLDTVVGERGIRLSGGQRQRVAIARALYREPPVLVLDEGTSALDSATEAALVAAMDETKQGRTLIAVAHRITTLRDADRILVVAGGRIVEQGTYTELLERSELFQSLAG